MSELPLHDGPGPQDPEDILRRLPKAEHEAFLAEYHAALDAAHEVWRYRQLQEALNRWNLIAIAISQPGYYEALAEARDAATPGVTIDEITAQRAAR